MSNSIPLQLAETLQTASINRNPDPAHDLNPSTAASTKLPVRISSTSHPPDPTSHSHSPSGSFSDLDDDFADPTYTVRPVTRRTTLPPLPDLRFEQSYLASLKDADTAWKIAFITVRDQVLAPLVQGVLWSLGSLAWRHWNRNARLSGSGAGARVRRWWYRVNNWPVPGENGKGAKLAADTTEFYQNQSSND